MQPTFSADFWLAASAASRPASWELPAAEFWCRYWCSFSARTSTSRRASRCWRRWCRPACPAFAITARAASPPHSHGSQPKISKTTPCKVAGSRRHGCALGKYLTRRANQGHSFTIAQSVKRPWPSNSALFGAILGENSYPQLKLHWLGGFHVGCALDFRFGRNTLRFWNIMQEEQVRPRARRDRV